MRVSDQGVYYSGGKPYGTGYEMMARIRELEAALEEAKAVAHGRGYQQGKAAGDAFGAAMREHVARLEAENKALREGRGVVLETLPPECAPKGCPVLVAGGIAMKKTGGEWYSGMTEPAFERPITWEVKWWAPIPDQNDLSALSPAPVSVGNVRPDIWASHMCHELRQAGYLVPYERMGMAMQAVARAALAETEGE